MHWYIQSTGIVIDWEKPMLDAIQRKGLPWSAVGVVPFEGTITGIDDIQEPCIFIGSTKLIDTVIEKGWKPGAMFDKEWFDPRTCSGKRSDMLNDQMKTITVKQLREEWVQEVTFVKSVNVKVLTGMVLEPEVDDWLCWTEERADIDERELLVTSPYRKLEKEWRFFIVDGLVVAGSIYRRDGYRCLTEPIAQDIWDKAQEMAEMWLPNDTVVMDVGLLASGYFCVVEFNCINSSGVYKADADRIVEALENKFIGV